MYSTRRIAALRDPTSPSAGSLDNGVLDILNPFRRRGAAPRRTKPVSELWRIDLGPVDEPMVNGRSEPISLKTNERMAFGRASKRIAEPAIGRATERSFDWQSVQPPDRPVDSSPAVRVEAL